MGVGAPDTRTLPIIQTGRCDPDHGSGADPWKSRHRGSAERGRPTPRPGMNILSRFGLMALLAVSAHLLPAGRAFATVPAPVAGDVFVGFRASDGTGASVSYLVKIGSDTTFRNAPAGTEFDVAGLGGVGADLAAAYGSDWHTRSDLYWSVFSVRNGVSPVVYGSRARSAPGTVASPWPALSTTARAGTASAITAVLEEVGGYKGSDNTANSAVATLQTNFGGQASYNFQVGTPGTSDFSSVSQWSSIEAGFVSGPGGAVLDLFRVGSSVSHVGTFSIGTDGTIHFAAPPAAGTTDTDGDGYIDAIEASAGTNPASASSYPQAIVSLTLNGPRIQTATAAANRTYSVEYSETLASGSWIAVNSHATGAAASLLDFTDVDTTRRSKGRGFYRVRYTP